MAKIKMSPLVKKIQGSVDGLLFSESRGVATVRTKKTPTNPDTLAQQVSRKAMARLMGIWPQISDRIASSYEYGDVNKNQTVINRFLARLLALEMVESSYSLSPPTSTPACLGPAFIEFVNCNAVSVSFSPSPAPNNYHLILIHRVDSAVPGAPPVMTVYPQHPTQVSPKILNLTNCEDGDNYIYGFFSDITTALVGEGFGVFAEQV